MSKVLELSDDTYQQLTELAVQQHRTPEEILRLCLASYETAQYQRMHEQLAAEGLLVTMPTPPALLDDDFEPEDIPGKPLSEIILEDRI
jgi:predicted transcriptional regulator